MISEIFPSSYRKDNEILRGVFKCPTSRSWLGVQRTDPQQGVKECTFCSGSDLNLLTNKLKRHSSYLHPRQVALNRRMGHGDADWICLTTLRPPRLDLCLQSQL